MAESPKTEPTNSSAQTKEEPEKDESPAASGSSWWGSWIDTAKTKSASVLEAVKKDLDELTTAVKTEATNASTVFADSLKFSEPESTASTVKKSLSSFFGQVTEVLNPSMTEDEDVETVMITKDGLVTLSGFHKHLGEMQSNDDTFLVEPCDELLETYRRWMEVVDQDQFTEPRLAKQLASSQILNEKYESLVPGKVAHMPFWQRYLFKRALLEDALANAEMAEKRAKQEINSTQSVSPRKQQQIVQTKQPKKVSEEEPEPAVVIPATATKEPVSDSADDLVVVDEELSQIVEKELKWGGVEEDFSCNLDLSEEEQARLLAEYEQEIQERENKKKETKKPQESKTKTKTQQAAKKEPAKNAKPTQKSQPKGGAKPKGKTAQGPKDDSDESWEKEFDLDE